MTIHPVDAAAWALVLAMVLVPAARTLGRRHLADGDLRDPLGRAMPRTGGMAIATAWAAATLIVVGRDSWPLLALAAIALVIGLHDDLFKSSARWRLAVLGALALNAAAFGFRVDTLSLPGGVSIELGAAAIPLSALWIVGTNVAFDFADGLDGLATGFAVIAGVGLLAAGAGGPVAGMTAGLVGACVGFGVFNRPAASIHMGDNGSNLVGFVIGCLTLVGLRGAGGEFPLLAGLLLVAVPVLDVGLAVTRRVISGTDPFVGDERHLHHRLQEGRSANQALFVLLSSATLCAFAAVRGGSALLLAGVALVWLLVEAFSPGAASSRRSSPGSRRS